MLFRSGAGHQVVFVFNATTTSPSGASVKDAANNNVGSVSASASGNEVILSVSGLPDNQRATVSLASVNGKTVNASAAIGFLAGDVNASRAVTASDILRTKGRAGQAANSANYLYDVDVTGAINASDVSAVKQRAGLALP